MNGKPVVDVAIIGAGPGGLAAAHALLLRGLSVKVFERARELRLIGAALGLFPNAYKALEAINPELCLQVLNVGVEPSEQILQNSKGDILFHGLPPFSGLKAKYGHPFQWIGWFRLQSILQDALPADIISLDHYCTSFTQNSDSVSVHFKGQDSVEAGLLVGADGINSVVRQLLLNDGSPRYMDTMSWRAVVQDMDGVCSPGEFRLISCSSFKPYCQQLQNRCSATILVATDIQFKCVTAYQGKAKTLQLLMSEVGLPVGLPQRYRKASYCLLVPLLRSPAC
jgi:salicylate hydroxylase